MKRFTFLLVMVLMLVTLAGCKKGNVSIKTSEIEENTMLVKSDGVVQAATVEEFKESYYNLEELKEFINKNLAEFNQKVGNETAVVLDSLEQRKGNAIMVLEYANMSYYSEFNDIKAKLLAPITDTDELPGTLTNAQEEGTVTKNEVLAMEDAKAVILSEEYHLIVSGKIKCYAGGTILDKNEIQTTADGTVVVFE